MSDAPKPAETVRFRRRDILEAEKVAGVPASKLFYDEDGERVATALGSLAMQYVVERRAGLTDADFDSWLDEESDEFEVEVDDPS